MYFQKNHSPQSYEFVGFRLNIKERTLQHKGEFIHLTPKVFNTLLILIERRGQLVRKDELMNALWPNSFVEEGNLTQNIFYLRKILGERESGQQFIQTVPKVGYRFTVDVRERFETSEDTGEEQAGPATDPVPLEATAAPPAADVSHGARASGYFGFALKQRLRHHAAALYAHRFLSILLPLNLLALILIYFVQGSETIKQAPVAIESLAVLPFKEISGETTGSNLGLGMTDTLITKLGQLGRPIVRPTSSVFKYVDKVYDPLVAGKELKVDAVMDGTVQRVGERVRVSLRLIRVKDGQTLWAAVLEERLEDIFNVQDAIAQRAALSMGHTLSGGLRDRLAKHNTNNVEAYEAYVRAVYQRNKFEESAMQKSITYFQDAINQDPNYAQAYAGLADASALLGIYVHEKPRKAELFESAKANAVKAKQLDSTLSEAYTAHYLVRRYYENDWAGAEAELRRAIELNDSNALSYVRYGLLLRDKGDLAGAQTKLLEGSHRDPISFLVNFGLVTVFYYRGEYEQALQYCLRIAETETAYKRAERFMAAIYVQQGRYDEALKIYNEHCRTLDDPLRCHGALAYAFAKAGRRDEALLELQKVKDAIDTGPKHRFLAGIYSELGDNDQALAHLEADDYNDNGMLLCFFKFDPCIARVRSDPRFSALFKRRFGTQP